MTVRHHRHKVPHLNKKISFIWFCDGVWARDEVLSGSRAIGAFDFCRPNAWVRSVSIAKISPSKYSRYLRDFCLGEYTAMLAHEDVNDLKSKKRNQSWRGPCQWRAFFPTLIGRNPVDKSNLESIWLGNVLATVFSFIYTKSNLKLYDETWRRIWIRCRGIQRILDFFAVALRKVWRVWWLHIHLYAMNI